MNSVGTLGDLVRQQAAKYGEKTALRFGGEDISFTELDSRANRIANGLAASGVGAGDRVAFIGKNHPAYFELVFGAAKLGAVIVPTNWRLADPEISWLVKDSEARIVFCGDGFEERVSALLTGTSISPTLIGSHRYAVWRDEQDRRDPEGTVSTQDVAVQLYTSGTTGKPKGAMLTHHNLLVFRAMPPEQQPEWNRFTDDDVSLLVMPMFHIGGTGYGIQTLAAGATGLVAQEFDRDQVLSFIERERLSKIFVVPSALQMLVEHPRAGQIDYSRIRTILYGASPIPLALLRKAMATFGCGFVQMYGMTETCGTICALPPEDHDEMGNDRMGSAGRPLNGVELCIVDDDGDHLSAGEIGEIAVRAPLVMAGYWRQPDATAQAMLPGGWFRTGDAGYIDHDGYLFLKDRVKDMIVSGGENVYPAEVEAALWDHPAVAEVSVIGVPSEKWGEEVKAVVVLKSDAQVHGTELIAWARQRIAGYKVPKSVDIVPSLPRGPTGKILRREIRAPYWKGRDRQIN